MHRLRVRWALVPAVIAALVAIPLVAAADSNHGRPDCTSLTLIDEPAFGSRDGYDHFHVQGAGGIANSLAELEGFVNVCRANDSAIVEAVSGGARGIRSTGVVRIAVRANLQQFFDDDGAGPNAAAWHTVKSSALANSGTARTVSVSSDYVDEVDSVPAFRHTWTRVNVRALIRYGTSTGPLVFAERFTYPIWTGDGPVSPATPPA